MPTRRPGCWDSSAAIPSGHPQRRRGRERADTRHIHPTPGLLERHTRQRTAHAALSADILSWLAGTSPPGAGSSAAPLSQAETCVLRYLPTHLPAPEIAGELCVSDRLRCPPGPRRPVRHWSAEDAFPGMPLRFGLAEGDMEVLRLVAAGRGNRGHRQRAVHLAQDRQRPRVQHPGQARRLHPHPSRCHRPPAVRPRRQATSAA